MSRRHAAAALLLLGWALAACGGSTPSDSLAGSASASAPASPEAAGSGTLEAARDIEAAGATRIDVAGRPDWLAVAAGSAWVAVDGGVRRLDGSTGTPDGLVPVPGVICLAFDVGFDSLWAGSCDRHLLARIDPPTGSLDTPFIDLPIAALQAEGSIGVGASGVWLISTDHQLLHLDPVTNRVDGTWPLPESAAAAREGLGWLWVSVPATDALLRIDPADPRSSRSIKVGDGPRFLAIGDDAVWVMNQADGSVSRVDPAGTVVATVAVSDAPIRGGDIAVGGGSVWVRTEQDLVVTIDPATNQVRERYGPPSGSGSVAVDADAAWISAHDTASVHRLPLPHETQSRPTSSIGSPSLPS
jgi:streptogramin lyase